MNDVATVSQGITYNNVSNNDIIINKLTKFLPNFPGAPNWCHCFLHIINLIAKLVLKQFNVPDKWAEATFDWAEHELLKSAVGIDMEEILTVAEQGAGGDSEGNDNVEGWMDETALMSIVHRGEGGTL